MLAKFIICVPRLETLSKKLKSEAWVKSVVKKVGIDPGEANVESKYYYLSVKTVGMQRGEQAINIVLDDYEILVSNFEKLCPQDQQSLVKFLAGYRYCRL
jgi:hypothetical protein